MSVNRFVCEVLTEMRTAIKVGRIDIMEGLIEEAQTLVNRMEAKLGDYSDWVYDLARGREYKRKLQVIRTQADGIELKLDAMEEDIL